MPGTGGRSRKSGDRRHYIQFTLDGFGCALYPNEAIARLFGNRDQALEFFDCLVDFLNGIDFRRDSLEPDYKKFKNVPVLEILKLLPRKNCKECGLSSCMAFAAALGNGNLSPGIVRNTRPLEQKTSNCSNSSRETQGKPAGYKVCL